MGENPWVAMLHAVAKLRKCLLVTDFCKHEIGNQAFQTAADVIRTSQTLTSFCVSALGTGEVSNLTGFALAGAISLNSKLTHLKLAGAFGEEVGTALANALGRNTVLKSFTFEAGRASVSDNTFIAMGKSLEVNKSLQFLKLEIPWMNLGDHGAEALRQGIAENWTLHFFAFAWLVEDELWEEELGEHVLTILHDIKRLVLRNRHVHAQKQRLLQLAPLCKSMTLDSLKGGALRECVFSFLCPSQCPISLF